MATVNIKLTIDLAQTRPPTGVVFDHIDVTLTDSSGSPQTQAIPGSTAPSVDVTFANVQDGKMTASAVAKDNQGNDIGAPATGTFDSSTGEFPSPTAIHFAVV
jgi:hypothetical protein